MAAALLLGAVLLGAQGARPARRQLLTVSTLPADSAVLWGPNCPGRLLVKAYFAVCYSEPWREPYWVAYGLKVQPGRPRVGRLGRFKVDSALPESVWARPSDYAGFGFDIGHMAPANDFRFAEEAQRSTFVLSNAAPQHGPTNRGRWRSLETEVQSLALRHGAIWVFTGPLFLDSLGRPTAPTRHIGADSVAVPSHFFKVILCYHPGRDPEMAAFLMPNATTTLPGPTSRYAVPVDSIETLAGLDFFKILPDSLQHRLEAARPKAWPIP